MMDTNELLATPLMANWVRTEITNKIVRRCWLEIAPYWCGCQRQLMLLLCCYEWRMSPGLSGAKPMVESNQD